MNTLINHLKHGKLGHQVFNLNYYNSGSNECGTTGCAIGEFPIIWPDTFKFAGYGIAELYDLTLLLTSKETACKWLEISETDFDLLFTPRDSEYEGTEDDINRFKFLMSKGVKWLPGNSTQYQVAENLQHYIKIINNDSQH